MASSVGYATTDVIDNVQDNTNTQTKDLANRPKDGYFIAERDMDNGGIIIGSAITEAEAVERIKAGQDVYTPYLHEALSLTFKHLMSSMVLKFMQDGCTNLINIRS